MSIFKKKNGRQTGLAAIVTGLREFAQSTGSAKLVAPAAAKQALGLESMDQITSSNLETGLETLERALQNVSQTYSMESFSTAQLEAARVAAVISADPAAYFNQKFESEKIDAEYVNFEIPDIKELKNVLKENPDLIKGN